MTPASAPALAALLDHIAEELAREYVEPSTVKIRYDRIHESCSLHPFLHILPLESGPEVAMKTLQAGIIVRVQLYGDTDPTWRQHPGSLPEEDGGFAEMMQHHVSYDPVNRRVCHGEMLSRSQTELDMGTIGFTGKPLPRF